MNKRQVSNLAVQVEYKPAPFRQVSNLIIQAEYVWQEPLTLATLENALSAIRGTLHTNPNADISSPVAVYKAAIESAFGVSFEVQGGDNWVFISLHFARQGLEATAQAFKRWAVTQGKNPLDVNAYALFRRVMNTPFKIINVGTVNLNAVAQVIAPDIIVYKRSETRQWTMTPNNVIHELGHKLDGRAGFGFKKLGSMEYSIETAGAALHNNYSRAGMAEGRTYLRVRALEHSQITLSSTVPDKAEYSVITEKQPIPTDPDYAAFVPYRYLFNDIASNQYSVWQSPVYTQWAGSNARIDTLVINETADKTETAADAFLNWVRDGERPTFVDAPGETQAAGWRNFFATNIGMFLRNAVIYGLGMKTHFQPLIFPPSPQRNINPGTFQVRLAPVVNESTNLGKAFDPNDPDNDLNLFDTRTYGWATSEGFNWFLIEDRNERLVWIIFEGVKFVSGEDNAENRKIANPLILSPGKPYEVADLMTIIG